MKFILYNIYTQLITNLTLNLSLLRHLAWGPSFDYSHFLVVADFVAITSPLQAIIATVGLLLQVVITRLLLQAVVTRLLLAITAVEMPHCLAMATTIVPKMLQAIIAKLPLHPRSQYQTKGWQPIPHSCHRRNKLLLLCA